MQDELPKKDDDVSLFQKRDSLFTNIILAALLSNFLLHYYHQFTVEHKFSAFLMFIQVTFLIMFFLLRVIPKRVSYSRKDWFFALAGTWLPMLILPTEASKEIPVLLILQLIGVVISTIGIVSLNKSLGVVPALREIKTRGMYRVVRHPIYFGYMISFTCITFQNFSFFNVAVLISIVICDVMRIVAEEKILESDDEYVEYQKRVRWRLIPFLW